MPRFAQRDNEAFLEPGSGQSKGGHGGETRLQNSRQRHARVRAPRSLYSVYESQMGRSDSARPAENNPWADQVFFCRWAANTVFRYAGVGCYLAKKEFRGELPGEAEVAHRYAKPLARRYDA